MKHFVVFDLDGTLLDTIPDIGESMNQALAKNGIVPHPLDAYKRFTGNGVKVLSQRASADTGELALKVQQDYMRIYARNSRVKTAPYAGIKELLRALLDLGVALIVFSNKDDPDTKEVVAHYFPEVSFLEALGSVPGVPLKPDPSALLRVIAEHGLRREDGIYIGDTRTDMQTAKAAGLYAVAVGWGFQTKEDLLQEQPAALIDHPLDLLGIAKARFNHIGD